MGAHTVTISYLPLEEKTIRASGFEPIREFIVFKTKRSSVEGGWAEKSDAYEKNTMRPRVVPKGFSEMGFLG